MNVAVISVHYYGGRAASTLHAVDPLLAKLGETTRVHVANSDAAHDELTARPAVRIGSGAASVIRHANSGLEFGGYQAGIDALGLGRELDWVVFVNDTFHVHQVMPRAYLRYLAMHIGRQVAHPVIAGQVEGLSRSFELCGVRTHRWITTNLFAMNRAALEAIDWKIYDPSLDALVHETAVVREFTSSALDPVLAEHITSYLFGRRGHGATWYAAEPLVPGNARQMARKARSILQEKAVAARLEGRSAEFASIREISLIAQAAVKLWDRARKLSDRMAAP